MPLSEKAKGKQRAVEPQPVPEPPVTHTPDQTRDLVIRFSEGVPDLVVSVGQRDAVRDVKEKASIAYLSSFLDGTLNTHENLDSRWALRTQRSTASTYTFRPTSHGRNFFVLLADVPGRAAETGSAGY